MGRIARVVAPGCRHHVTQRGNLRQTAFFDDADRALYLDILRRHCRRTGLRIAGYCLMSNHIHLIAVPPDGAAMATALGRTHGDYARWLHVRRAEVGHLWQNRYFSCPPDERHQWEALRYVESNPVRAGLAAFAEARPWSSAGARTGGADRADLLEDAPWRQRWTPARWRKALRAGVADAALMERIRTQCCSH
jgi:putative transposase